MSECITDEASKRANETAAERGVDGHAGCSTPNLRAEIVCAARLLATSLSNRPANDRIRRSILPQAARASAPGVPSCPDAAPAACLSVEHDFR